MMSELGSLSSFHTAQFPDSIHDNIPVFTEIQAVLNPQVRHLVSDVEEMMSHVEEETGVEIKLTRRRYVLVGQLEQIQKARTILEGFLHDREVGRNGEWSGASSEHQLDLCGPDHVSLQRMNQNRGSSVIGWNSHVRDMGARWNSQPANINRLSPERSSVSSGFRRHLNVTAHDMSVQTDTPPSDDKRNEVRIPSEAAGPDNQEEDSIDTPTIINEGSDTSFDSHKINTSTVREVTGAQRYLIESGFYDALQEEKQVQDKLHADETINGDNITKMSGLAVDPEDREDEEGKQSIGSDVQQPGMISQITEKDVEDKAKMSPRVNVSTEDLSIDSDDDIDKLLYAKPTQKKNDSNEEIGKFSDKPSKKDESDEEMDKLYVKPAPSRTDCDEEIDKFSQKKNDSDEEIGKFSDKPSKKCESVEEMEKLYVEPTLRKADSDEEIDILSYVKPAPRRTDPDGDTKLSYVKPAPRGTDSDEEEDNLSYVKPSPRMNQVFRPVVEEVNSESESNNRADEDTGIVDYFRMKDEEANTDEDSDLPFGEEVLVDSLIWEYMQEQYTEELNNLKDTLKVSIITRYKESEDCVTAYIHNQDVKQVNLDNLELARDQFVDMFQKIQLGCAQEIFKIPKQVPMETQLIAFESTIINFPQVLTKQSKGEYTFIGKPDAAKKAREHFMGKIGLRRNAHGMFRLQPSRPESQQLGDLRYYADMNDESMDHLQCHEARSLKAQTQIAMALEAAEVNALSQSDSQRHRFNWEDLRDEHHQTGYQQEQSGTPRDGFNWEDLEDEPNQTGYQQDPSSSHLSTVSNDDTGTEHGSMPPLEPVTPISDFDDPFHDESDQEDKHDDAVSAEEVVLENETETETENLPHGNFENDSSGNDLKNDGKVKTMKLRDDKPKGDQEVEWIDSDPEGERDENTDRDKSEDDKTSRAKKTIDKPRDPSIGWIDSDPEEESNRNTDQDKLDDDKPPQVAETVDEPGDPSIGWIDSDPEEESNRNTDQDKSDDDKLRHDKPKDPSIGWIDEDDSCEEPENIPASSDDNISHVDSKVKATSRSIKTEKIVQELREGGDFASEKLISAMLHAGDIPKFIPPTDDRQRDEDVGHSRQSHGADKQTANGRQVLQKHQQKPHIPVSLEDNTDVPKHNAEKKTGSERQVKQKSQPLKLHIPVCVEDNPDVPKPVFKPKLQKDGSVISTCDAPICTNCVEPMTGIVKLECGHQFCVTCVRNPYRMVDNMCPECGEMFLREILKQPDGGMMTHIMDKKTSLPHFPKCGTMMVKFSFQEGVIQEDEDEPKPYAKIDIHTFLPSNTDGKAVYKMLFEAHRSRKLFEVNYVKGCRGLIVCVKGITLKRDQESITREYLGRLTKQLKRLNGE